MLMLFGCGGGASSYNPPPPPPPPPPALTITTQSPLPRAVLGQPYTAKLQATGGVPPYTWSTQLLGIPGMTLGSDGTLSGTPAQQATFIPNFTVTDSKGTTVTAPVELDVIAPLAFSTAAALPDQNIALPVYMYIAVSGGVQPYTFSLAPGSTMPPGLTFTNANSVGLIQGAPTTPGSYSFTVQVTDSFTPPFKISQTFTQKILNGVVVPNSTLPDAVQDIPYKEQIKVFGGTPPYHFVLFPLASTPPGLTLDTSTGFLSGTPTTSSQYTDTMYMYINDSAPTPATIQAYISINVQPALSFQTTSLPDSARGLNYGGSLYIVGGRAPYTVQVANGTLPDGLTISSTPYGNTFNVTGVPTKDGTFQFTLKVSDSYETPNTASQNFQIRISDPLAISGPGFVQILYNQSYSATFPVTGGIPPYTWGMSPVPSGFTFDPTTGTLSGTPNGGSYTSPGISVHDSSNPPQTVNYFNFVLEVWAKLVIQTTSLPPVATESSVWLQPLTNGGAAPFQWSISSGSLPAGLSLGPLQGSGTIAITGSPTTAGTYNFTLAISDGNPGALHQTTSQPLTLVVKDRGQMTRNDTVATATPVSNISLLASISPYSDPSTTGPDVDYYSAGAAPGSIVQVYVSPNNDFLQPPEPNSLQPVLEIVDSTGTRYQTCGYYGLLPGQVNNLPCINHLPGNQYLSNNYYAFQVPGSGTSPVTFFIRVLDVRGDARPDFIYTFTIFGVN
jgi:Putative Ig domain